VLIQVLVEVILQVVLDIYLILGRWDDYIVVLDDAVLVYLRPVVQKPARRLYEANTNTGLGLSPDGLLINYLYGSQDIDRIVHTLQDLDRLREVIVVDVVRGKGRKCGCRVGLRPGMKEIPVQVDPRERTDEIVFSRIGEPIPFCM
jgi:hypothetical protein